MHAQEMLSTHPQAKAQSKDPSNDALIRAVEASYDCAQACTSCADACLGEDEVQDMIQCIRTCLDCADICVVAGALATRRTGANDAVVAAQLQVCEEACRVCAEECERHAEQMGHCRVCGEACRRCEDACAEARRAFPARLQ